MKPTSPRSLSPKKNTFVACDCNKRRQGWDSPYNYKKILIRLKKSRVLALKIDSYNCKIDQLPNLPQTPESYKNLTNNAYIFLLILTQMLSRFKKHNTF